MSDQLTIGRINDEKCVVSLEGFGHLSPTGSAKRWAAPDSSGQHAPSALGERALALRSWLRSTTRLWHLYCAVKHSRKWLSFLSPILEALYGNYRESVQLQNILTKTFLVSVGKQRVSYSDRKGRQAVCKTVLQNFSLLIHSREATF